MSKGLEETKAQPGNLRVKSSSPIRGGLDVGILAGTSLHVSCRKRGPASALIDYGSCVSQTLELRSVVLLILSSEIHHISPAPSAVLLNGTSSFVLCSTMFSH